jgi:hypothetical protein
MSLLGQSRPGRADSRSGHVGFHPIATKFCDAAEFRYVPILLQKSFETGFEA